MLNRLVEQWSEVVTALGKMSPNASVRPNGGWEIIRAAEGSTADLVRFVLQPVVFNLPERANHLTPDLFVVGEGWVDIRRQEYKSGQGLVTNGFATRVAYFRRSTDGLRHVYGAHYDLAVDELGHPVFHSQMRSLCELHEHVRTHFGVDGIVKDVVQGVLGNVRVPTAQMDFFSFVLQVFADHLLFSRSGQEERNAFNVLLKRSELLQGSQRLTTEVVRSCFRARHWYPVIT